MTAVGDVVPASNVKRAVCLLTAQTANNLPPTLATQGIPNYPLDALYATDTGACFAVLCATESSLMISSSAGSGVMTGTFTIWGYLVASAQWYPVKVNGGAAIGEYPTIADKITYWERFLDLGHFDRLYLELSAVGGTATAFEAWVVTGRMGQ